MTNNLLPRRRKRPITALPIHRGVPLPREPRTPATATLTLTHYDEDEQNHMALVVFFRGINVGGHRRFRPSILARELHAYDVVNVGAAGTLIVRKPASRANFIAELRRKLPFPLEIALCDGRDLLRLESDNPFGSEPPRPDLVRFLSILSKAGHCTASPPIAIPDRDNWFVQVIGSKNQFVYGVYRRHMKTIGYLGQLDNLFGAPATTRSWTTILSVLRILRAGGAGRQ